MVLFTFDFSRGSVGSGRCGWRWGLALVALGEEAKGVDLLDEVGHAGPTSETKPNYEDPPDHERIQHVHPGPARQEEWWLLCRILQEFKTLGMSLPESSRME